MHRTLVEWKRRLAEHATNPITDAEVEQYVADQVEGSDLTYCITARVAGAMRDPVAEMQEGTNFTDLLRLTIQTHCAVLGITPWKFLADMHAIDAPGAKSIRNLFALVIGIDPDEVPSLPEQFNDDHDD